MARLLVVDDQAVNRQLLQTVAGSIGHSVLEASGGEEALALARSHRPNLIITDILMPVMDGIEFTRRLRRDPEIGDTRVVFYTATYLEGEVRRLAESCGVVHFLVKPCEPQDIFDVIEIALAADPPATTGGPLTGFELEHTRVLNDKLIAKIHELEDLNQRHDALRIRLGTSQREYRTLFEHSPLPMWIYDSASLRILQANRAALVHYRYRREEFLALTMRDILIADDDLPGLLAAADAATSADRLGPFRHRRSDGAEIEVRVTVHAVVFEGVSARFLIAEDVGEQERLARQLHQAQRLESLGELAGGVAHDFNNLLSVIGGYSAFVKKRLLEAIDPGELQSFLVHDIDQIEQAAERAARLTRQLLTFARRDVVRTEVVDVNAVLRTVEELLERTLGDQVELVTAFADSIWPVVIDRGQLEQVLVNLAVNARDAMPVGGRLHLETKNVNRHLAAATRPADAAGGWVRLRVTDTGTGMEAGTIEHAFEPFFTTKPLGSSTGLGLATVYGIVTHAGGTIDVDSEPGRGTTFTVLLPAVPGAPLGTGREPEPSLGAVSGDETVLVVEDQPALREATVRMLRDNGYEVLEAPGGVEAIEIAKAFGGSIDLLVTDVVLPRMSGPTLAAKLCAIRPDIQVLYVSGYASPTIASGALDGGVALLEKPFTEHQLVAEIREVLDRREPA